MYVIDQQAEMLTVAQPVRLGSESPKILHDDAGTSKNVGWNSYTRI